MATIDDVDELIEQYHLAIGKFLKGNPYDVYMKYWRDVVLTH